MLASDGTLLPDASLHVCATSLLHWLHRDGACAVGVWLQAAAQSFCPELADGVMIHMLETSGQTRSQVDALFASGKAVVVDATPGSKSVTPTAALLALCPSSPPAGDAANPITASCVTARWNGGTASDDGSLVEVPAAVRDAAAAAQDLVELLSLATATQTAMEALIRDTQTDFRIVSCPARVPVC